MSNFGDAQYRRNLGARILSEANDLKRTSESLAEELGYDHEEIGRVISGESDLKTIVGVIHDMVRIYPVSLADLWVEQDDTDENIFWDGFTAHYDLNVAHIPVSTNLEAQLKSCSKEDACTEVKKICAEKSLFEGYEWKIENCNEDGINDLSETLKNKIIEIIGEDLEACIEECA